MSSTRFDHHRMRAPPPLAGLTRRRSNLVRRVEMALLSHSLPIARVDELTSAGSHVRVNVLLKRNSIGLVVSHIFVAFPERRHFELFFCRFCRLNRLGVCAPEKVLNSFFTTL